jgi:hypothetical protein
VFYLILSHARFQIQCSEGTITSALGARSQHQSNVPEVIPLLIISTIFKDIKPASDSFKPASDPFPLSTTQNYLPLHSRSCPLQLFVAAPAPTMTRSAVCRLYTTSTSCRAGAVKQCAYSGRCVISISPTTLPPSHLPIHSRIHRTQV